MRSFFTTLLCTVFLGVFAQGLSEIIVDEDGKIIKSPTLSEINFWDHSIKVKFNEPKGMHFKMVAEDKEVRIWYDNKKIGQEWAKEFSRIDDNSYILKPLIFVDYDDYEEIESLKLIVAKDGKRTTEEYIGRKFFGKHPLISQDNTIKINNSLKIDSQISEIDFRNESTQIIFGKETKVRLVIDEMVLEANIEGSPLFQKSSNVFVLRNLNYYLPNDLDIDLMYLQIEGTNDKIYLIGNPAPTKPIKTCENNILELTTGEIIPNIGNGIAESFITSNRQNDYRVIYDLSTNEPTITYYKLKKNDSAYYFERKIKIRPAVTKNVGFHVFGYRPSFDSLAFNYRFESKNLELSESFSSVITPTTSEATGDTVTVSDENESITRSGTRSQEGVDIDTIAELTAKYRIIKFDLESYFTYISRYNIDESLVSSDFQFISSKLESYCLYEKEKSLRGLSHKLLKLSKNDPSLNEIIKEILKYYSLIENYSSFKIPVVQMQNEDMLHYDVDYFKNGKKATTSNHYLITSGGWKIDFSSGFILHNLLDKEYVTQDSSITDTTSVSRIIEKNKGNLDVSIGILSHVYPRTGRRANVGLSTGFILDNGTTVRYLAGGSLMLGYEQRFILSGGWIGGKVNRLDNSYNRAFNNYVDSDELASISSSVPTIQTWSNGFFLGITYNLGGTSLTN